MREKARKIEDRGKSDSEALRNHLAEAQGKAAKSRRIDEIQGCRIDER
ncbi:MAG TPA: hypothetical protein VKA79_01930 [Aestuariivirgaceae bacterium]|nr:hypothetical protein [Aestuariivirgaceae bacterium]